jgi:hypothetical protein
MTEARLVPITREALRDAMRKGGFGSIHDFTKGFERGWDAALAALPAAAPAEGLREAVLRLVDEHAFIDYPTPRCDCEEWPAKDDTDKHWDEHFATVAAAALTRHESAGSE